MTNKLRIGFHVSRDNNKLHEALEIAYELLVSKLPGDKIIPCFQIFVAGPRSFKPVSLSDDDIIEVNKFIEKTKSIIVAHGTYLDRPFDKHIHSPEIKSIVSQEETLQKINNSYGPIIHLSSASRKHGPGPINSLNDHRPIILFETDATKSLGSIDELIDSINDLESKISSGVYYGIIIDTAHLYESGIDLHDPKVMTQLLNRLPDTVIGVHLNDSKTDLGSGNDQHSYLGFKVFNGPGGISSLKHIISWAKNEDKMMIIENKYEDLIKSLDLLSSIL